LEAEHDMKPTALFFSMILAMTTAACVGGGDRRMPLSEDMQEEGRIRFERNTDYDGPVLTIFGDEGRPALTTARNAVDSGNPFRPAMPGHSGWSWTLINTAQDSTTYAYALIAWANDDPSDYLAAGYWIHYFMHPPGPDDIQVAIFIDGPELDPMNPPLLPMQGQASYSGLTAGTYVYQYGENWGQDLAGTYGVEEYAATITLAADFSDSTLSGCIGCEGDIAIRRSHLHQLLGDEVAHIVASPTDYELHLAAVTFDPEGTFELPEVTVTHPERTITQTEGFWGGGFSNIADAAGNPRLVGGFSAARF
jgi:hypothetical protein